MNVVLDTNILVSALWSRNGTPAKVLSLVLTGAVTVCYDWRIMTEYRSVLSRPKFQFSSEEVNALLDWIRIYGRSVVAEPIADDFIHDDDKKFLEVAKFCDAKLITGNAKHFPDDCHIISAAEFIAGVDLY